MAKVVPLAPASPDRINVGVTLDGKVRMFQGNWVLPLDPDGAEEAARQLQAAAAEARHVLTLHKQMPVGLDEQGKIDWLTKRIQG
jgi:hypothetical protein